MVIYYGIWITVLLQNVDIRYVAWKCSNAENVWISISLTCNHQRALFLNHYCHKPTSCISQWLERFEPFCHCFIIASNAIAREALSFTTQSCRNTLIPFGSSCRLLRLRCHFITKLSNLLTQNYGVHLPPNVVFLSVSLPSLSSVWSSSSSSSVQKAITINIDRFSRGPHFPLCSRMCA